MLALLRTDASASRRYTLECAPVSPLGVPALFVTLGIPKRTSERKRRRALRMLSELLREKRTSRTLLESSFAERDTVRAMGFREADSAFLLTAMAGKIAAAHAAERHRALLCVTGAGKGATDTAVALAGEFRYVSLLTPEETFASIEEVLEPLGVTPERAGARPDADAAVFFAPPPFPVYLPARCRVLRRCASSPLIAGGREINRVRFTLPSRLAFTLPGRFDLSPILSDALEWGRIAPEDIAVAANTDRGGAGTP